MHGQIRLLRRLFLKLVLRGATADGLPIDALPSTVPAKLLGDMVFFALCGMTALYFLRHPVATLELYLHLATLVLVGVFLANAAADVLANPHEARVLSYRPVTLRAVIGAKTLVLGELALWLAGAFNLAGLVIASFTPGGSWHFIPAHVVAISFDVLFALGCVLLIHRYRVLRHLSGRWAGTIPWVIIGLYVAILAWSLDFKLEGLVARVSPDGNAAYLFPPAWFAGLDAGLGRGGTAAWRLAASAVVATGSVLTLGLVGAGGDATRWTTVFAARQGQPPRTTSRLLRRLMRIPLMTWGLQTSAAHAAFAVTVLYLTRSRDLRFRLFSALVPVLAMPWLLWLPGLHNGLAARFWTLVMGIYLAVFAFLAVQLIETSSDWRAARSFQFAPLPGPGELCVGARRAVLVLAVPPSIAYFAVLIWLAQGAPALVLLVPGIVAVPLFARLPNLLGRGVPLVSAPADGTTQQPLQVMSRFAWYSIPIAALFAAAGTRTFWILVGVEVASVGGYLSWTRRRLATMPWTVRDR